VRINNIPNQGMHVTQDDSIIAGHPVKVALHKGLERDGIVPWTGNGVFGLRLTESIPVEQVGMDIEVSRAIRRQLSANDRHPRPMGHFEPGADAA
jgi:hypothetical protein